MLLLIQTSGSVVGPVLCVASTRGGGSLLAGLLAAAGMLLVCVAMITMYRRRLARSERPAPTARERLEAAEMRSQGKAQLESLMVDVQELTRLCAGQIEAKAARLDALIAQAEDRIRALERLTGPVDSGEVRTEREGTSPRVETAHVRPRGRALGGPQRTVDPLTRQVYELADAGHGSLDIAQRLDEQVGKVDLILALRDR